MEFNPGVEYPSEDKVFFFFTLNFFDNFFNVNAKFLITSILNLVLIENACLPTR